MRFFFLYDCNCNNNYFILLSKSEILTQKNISQRGQAKCSFSLGPENCTFKKHYGWCWVHIYYVVSETSFFPCFYFILRELGYFLVIFIMCWGEQMFTPAVVISYCLSFIAFKHHGATIAIRKSDTRSPFRLQVFMAIRVYCTIEHSHTQIPWPCHNWISAKNTTSISDNFTESLLCWKSLIFVKLSEHR